MYRFLQMAGVMGILTLFGLLITGTLAPETYAPGESKEAAVLQALPAPEAPVPHKELAPIAQATDTPTPPPSPYSTSARTREDIIAQARGALVNIFCTTDANTVHPISGSGVLIDPRGVILTNAHVAQYVLLASQPGVQLSCVIRTGSPAHGRWKADVLYMPTAWIEAHAADIAQAAPLGTGEYDYALLLITGSEDGMLPPPSFPYFPFEIRQVSRVGDPTFLAAYPAEFSGAGALEANLDAYFAITSIYQLLTFSSDTIDAVSFEGVPLAQSGSSGGAAVNPWGFLIGIISTSSNGPTTAERNLRAITISYINRSLLNLTGMSLNDLLARDVHTAAAAFMEGTAPSLAESILDHLR